MRRPVILLAVVALAGCGRGETNAQRRAHQLFHQPGTPNLVRAAKREEHARTRALKERRSQEALEGG